MQLIEGVLRDYAWGSTTAIPELLGLPATATPVAEVWFGAHPSGPALVGPDATPLDVVVGRDPTAALGAAADFDTLPFLLKVIAAAEPLSLQVHPSTAQARAGFAREEAAGVAIDAPDRSFRDRAHKPEMICALTEFDALCGVREPETTLEVLASIEAQELDTVRSMIRADPTPAGFSRLLEWLLTLDHAAAGALVESVVGACRDRGEGPHAAERAMAADLGERYPGDPAVVIALLLNLVTLRPGEALFLGSGNLHAYLRGSGVEIMASSDNVLRGGLTAKHVDVAALIEVVDAAPVEPRVQRPPVVDGVARYDSPVPEFSLERIELDGTLTLDEGPAILLCTAGHATCGAHTLDRGAALWIPAADGPVELHGWGTMFRAGLGPRGVTDG
ncbi:MAG: mannose-6-phosphate isomerase, class I [Acidimicrobiales bacterium]